MKKTPLKKISKKRKLRLSGYSEKDLFLEIWNERPHCCEICGSFIFEAKTFCFAHLLPKGMFPEYRINKNNISIVCSLDCHAMVDKICSGNKNIIENTIANGEKISIKDYF